MYTSTTKIRVRYGETDQMGFLYYGNYALYYEVGRVEMLRDFGLSYKRLEQEGIIMPVLELRCKYIRPAKYDDLITVKTSLRQLPATRIVFYSELYNEQGELLNMGETTLLFINAQTMSKTPPPDYLVEKFLPFFSHNEKED